MKTKQFFLVIVALVFAANVFATETPKMSIIPLEDTKALVTVSHETPLVNEISIISDKGNVVYYKKSKKKMDGYKQVFDLSQLENGAYEVKMKVGNTTVKRGLDIKNGNIAVQQQRAEIDPYFSFADNTLKVSYLNFENEDIAVYVYNNQKLVFSKEIGDEFTVHRALDLSQLKTGNYDIMLASANKEFWFSVTR